ncbi:MAG: hypothetical protein ACR2RV_28450 [Verrucomicrobiales bacterium]
MNHPTSESSSDLQDLANLLRRRVEIIADHAWRDTDPDAHLEALKSVSLEIMAIHQSLAGTLPARLDHFLAQCSFEKALAYIEDGDTGH